MTKQQLSLSSVSPRSYFNSNKPFCRCTACLPPPSLPPSSMPFHGHGQCLVPETSFGKQLSPSLSLSRRRLMGHPALAQRKEEGAYFQGLTWGLLKLNINRLQFLGHYLQQHCFAQIITSEGLWYFHLKGYKRPYKTEDLADRASLPMLNEIVMRQEKLFGQILYIILSWKKVACIRKSNGDICWQWCNLSRFCQSALNNCPPIVLFYGTLGESMPDFETETLCWLAGWLAGRRGGGGGEEGPKMGARDIWDDGQWIRAWWSDLKSAKS